MENSFFDNDLITRFEEMLDHKKQTYFDTEELYEIIAYYLDIGDLEYAEKALNHGLDLHPGSIEIRIKELELSLDKNQLELASKLIDNLQKVAESDTDFLIACGKFWSLKKIPRQSIKFYLKALETGEDLEFIHNCLGNENMAIKDLDEALKHYKKALEFNLDDEYALYACIKCFEKMHRNLDCIKFLKQYLELRPYSEEGWMQLGHEYLAQKDYVKAFNSFEYASLVNPKSITAWAQMAYCKESLDEYQHAILCYDEIIALDESAAHTLVKASNCHLELNQPFKALKKLHRAIHLDPQMEKAWRNCSDLYEKLGNYEEALHYIENAHELNPTDTNLIKKFAYLNVQLGKYEEALQQFAKLLKLEDNNFYNWLGASELLITLGDYHKAILLLRRGVNKFKRAELYYQLSNCYYLLRKEELGLKSLTIARQLNPSLIEEMVTKYPILEQKIKPSGDALTPKL